MHGSSECLPLVGGVMLMLGSVTAVAARMKGRSPAPWFFLGATLGILGMALIALLPGVDRRCPMCGAPCGKTDNCESCGAPQPDRVTRQLLVPGKRYSDICPGCSLPYAAADYTPGTDIRCVRCDLGL